MGLASWNLEHEKHEKYEKHERGAACPNGQRLEGIDARERAHREISAPT
jgi:hypothetical protein